MHFYTYFLPVCGLPIYFFFRLFVYLAAPGLCCYTQAFSSFGEPGLLFLAAHRLLIAAASLVVEHRPRKAVVSFRLLSAGSVAVVHGLSCFKSCASFWTRD